MTFPIYRWHYSHDLLCRGRQGEAWALWVSTLTSASGLVTMLRVPWQERRTSQLHPDRGAELPHGMHCAKSQREKNPPKTTWPWPGVKAPGSYVPGSNTADRKLQRFPVDSVLFSWPNFFQTVNSCKSSTEPSINLVKSWLIPEQRNVLIVILARNAYIVIGLSAINSPGAKVLTTCHLLFFYLTNIKLLTTCL